MSFAYLDSPVPIAFAHRGGGKEGENALAAFEAAKQLGYRYIEIDVRTTRDGVPLVFHDRDLQRMTGHSGNVGDLTAEEIAQLQLLGGGTIPSLAEVLATFPSLRFNIDLKDAEAIEPVAHVLTEAAALQRVCVTSFSERRVAAARRLLGPTVCTGLGIGGTLRFFVRAILPGSPSRRSAAVIQLPLRWHGVRVITVWTVRKAHEAGLSLHAWTLNDEPSIKRALDMGVDGVITDELQLLKEVLISRGVAWPP